MKKIVIGLTIALSLFSIYALPKIIYGTFGTITGKTYDKVVEESTEITREQARELASSPSFADDLDKVYFHNVKYRVTYYSKPFWLTERRDTISSFVEKTNPSN